MKPYELSDEKIRSLIDKTYYERPGVYNITPFDRVLIKAAQKKLLEWLISDVLNTKQSNWPFIMSKLRICLKDFGL